MSKLAAAAVGVLSLGSVLAFTVQPASAADGPSALRLPGVRLVVGPTADGALVAELSTVNQLAPIGASAGLGLDAPGGPGQANRLALWAALGTRSPTPPPPSD
jgi:hypothetical protein